MTIALIGVVVLLLFLGYLRTQGQLIYYHHSQIVRRKDGSIMGAPIFFWKIENGFLCRLAGVNTDEQGFAPVYHPLFSISWGEGLFILDVGWGISSWVFVFEKALPFVHIIRDARDRSARDAPPW